MKFFFGWFLALLLIGIFVFLRFYNIENSFILLNDNGRDLSVMYDWKTTHKIPKLGPQNSALPFNQSALYYYLLFPFYLLTNSSTFFSIYANAFWYVFCFVLSLYLANTQRLKIITLITIFLIVIQPQEIAQNRYVWNPSFITPFLMVSLIAFLRLIEKWDRKILVIEALFLGAAVAMNYSIIPLFFAQTLYGIFHFKKNKILFLASQILGIILANLPTLFFDLTHSFILTKSLLNVHLNSDAAQSVGDKFTLLSSYLFSTGNNFFNSILLILVIIISSVVIYPKKDKKILLPVSIILLISFILTILSPFKMYPHYIFGILLPLFILIGSFKLRYAVICLIFLSIFWLNPPTLSAYFKIAPRTVSNLTACFQMICQKETEPLFVVVQSKFHNYHTGLEFRYLMEENGCNVKAIEQDRSLANKMAVVGDQDTYEQGRTSFYELSLFGPSKQEKVYSCQDNVNVYILQK